MFKVKNNKKFQANPKMLQLNCLNVLVYSLGASFVGVGEEEASKSYKKYGKIISQAI
jgi:hypothetical protein